MVTHGSNNQLPQCRLPRFPSGNEHKLNPEWSPASQRYPNDSRRGTRQGRMLIAQQGASSEAAWPVMRKGAA